MAFRFYVQKNCVKLWPKIPEIEWKGFEINYKLQFLNGDIKALQECKTQRKIHQHNGKYRVARAAEMQCFFNVSST